MHVRVHGHGVGQVMHHVGVGAGPAAGAAVAHVPVEAGCARAGFVGHLGAELQRVVRVEVHGRGEVGGAGIAKRVVFRFRGHRVQRRA